MIHSNSVILETQFTRMDQLLHLAPSVLLSGRFNVGELAVSILANEDLLLSAMATLGLVTATFARTRDCGFLNRSYG
jgi:hypothetical protein